MSLAERVRKKRKELDLTQDELARRMGYKSRVSINKIENGREVSQKIIVRLAEALNTTPAYLMGWEEEKSSLGNKDVMADNIKYYLELNEITGENLCKDLGFEYSEFTDWCDAKKYPRIDKIEKMANYFGIEKSDLAEVRKSGNEIGFGELLHLFRIERNISDVELAHEMGISVIEFRKYEKGQKTIPFDIMKKLADYFGIDITALRGFEVRRSGNDLRTSLRLLEITNRWNKEIGHIEFTDDELTQLINYAKFILSQRTEEE